MDEIRTPRLVLRRWRESDREPFAALNADPAVMEFFPARMARTESDALIDRIESHFDLHGYGLYAVDAGHGCIGFTGLSTLPLADEVEIGWRLAWSEWGKGYATEAGIAVLVRAFRSLGLQEIVSITARRNTRSQRVMQRIGLIRDSADDFLHPAIPTGHPLSPHVMYRARSTTWQPPAVAVSGLTEPGPPR